ncbi:hypothetical protein AB0I72_26650 [Nocardiopsis sp. NPDC049922]|uniref:hypothetical protein n=1 Tax=Nocardiopsis sp. NPDC049922 TaxID=3155157 RepID=UPI0033D0E925
MNGNSWTAEKDAEVRGVPSSASAVVAALTDPSLPIPSVTAEDVRTAREALVWTRGNENREHVSPYEKGLAKRLSAFGPVPLESVGVVSTVIPAFKDGVIKHKRKNVWAELSNSQYVTKFLPGKFAVVRSEPHTVSFTKKSGEEKTEVQTVVVLKDGNGNGYKWFDSKNHGLKVGQVVSIDRATIAGRSDFNGVRLTKINRVKLSV